MRLVVVGGGIGGLVAALSLAQRGFEVEVLEQQAEPREVGAGIALAANGLRVLSSLGLDPALAPLAHVPVGVHLRRGRSGRSIVKAARSPTERRSNLHRGDLRRVLLEAALASPKIEVRLGQRVVAIAQDASGASVETDSGLRVRGDALIGADGIHSVVRPTVAGPDAPQFSGEVVWRALVRSERLPAAAEAQFQTIWTGSDRHFLHYLVSGGKLLNVGGFVESDEWRNESWTQPGRKQDFARLFDAFHPLVGAIIDGADECFVQAIHQREPLAQWFAQRVVLLGDACHAMPPHVGQGAGMAIEDAAVLARSIADQPADLESAFQIYQAKRKPRVERVTATVRRVGRVWNTGNPVRGALIQSFIWLMSRLRPASPPDEWIFEYDALSA